VIMTIMVDHNAMGMASDDLSGDAKFLQDALDDLDSQVKVLAANWQGDARQAYLVAKGQWSEAMGQIRVTLGQISVQLAQTDQAFADIDRQGAAMWG